MRAEHLSYPPPPHLARSCRHPTITASRPHSNKVNRSLTLMMAKPTQTQLARLPLRRPSNLAKGQARRRRELTQPRPSMSAAARMLPWVASSPAADNSALLNLWLPATVIQARRHNLSLHLTVLHRHTARRLLPPRASSRPMHTALLRQVLAASRRAWQACRWEQARDSQRPSRCLPRRSHASAPSTSYILQTF